MCAGALCGSRSTKLRGPCQNLDPYNVPQAEGRIQDALQDKLAKAGDPSSRCWAYGGFYSRVLEPGLIRKGDPIRLLSVAA